MQETKTEQWNQNRGQKEGAHAQEGVGMWHTKGWMASAEWVFTGAVLGLGWEGNTQPPESKIVLFYYVQTIGTQTTHSENSRF